MSGTITQPWSQLVVCDRFADELDRDDPFEAMLMQEGEVVREANGRKTLRFTSGGRSYFAKIHTGVGWGEIVKNALRLRRPVTSASDEWSAIHRVRELGIRTPTPIAFGCRGRNPARLQSFLVTEDLGATITLAALAKRWGERPAEIDANLKRWLIDEVARIARTLHANGINHRDFYLCHFRIDEAVANEPTAHEFEHLCLMDLHRAQIRPRIPRRWLIKDLASLLFSAFDAPITRRDILRFMRGYCDAPLRDAIVRHERLWKQVLRRATRMYWAHAGRLPTPLDFLLKRR